MIIPYNWVILEKALSPDSNPKDYLKIPETSNLEGVMGQQSPVGSFRQTTIDCPLIPFLFSYCKKQEEEYNLCLQGEVHLGGNRLDLKMIEYRQWEGYIYFLGKIENSECYESALRLVVHVKYQEQKTPEIHSIGQLIKLVGARQVNVHSKKTYVSLRRQIYILEPFLTQYRYINAEKGYIWMKLTHQLPQHFQITIRNIKLMNWLGIGNQKFKEQNVQSTWNPKDQTIIDYKQAYSIMFIVNGSYPRIEMPYLLDYTINHLGYEGTFRIIKYLKLQ